MRGVVLGTAGHVDHGKTTLVRALTGVDTDRWREEKERGLTIDIGFARLGARDGVEVGVIDVPGHEDFVKNMLAGSTGIDLLLLVVAADEGPMPQTREHLSIAGLLGVEHGIVALSKTDRADPELRELALETTREELRTVLGHDRWPVVPVSAADGSGVEELREEIYRGSLAVPSRPEDDRFRLPVDRAFTVRGAGTVLTGTVWSGSLAVGDFVHLYPAACAARVRSLQVHGEPRQRVGAGRRAALGVVGVEPAEAPRGSVALGGEGWRAARRVGVRLRLLPHSPRRIEHGRRVRVFLGTTEVFARVALAGRDVLEPGGEAWALLALESRLVARVRDRFILRFYSPVTTVGGGRMAELDPPREWRSRIPEWERVLGEEAGAAVEAVVRLAGGAGVGEEELPLRTGLPPPAIDRTASATLRLGGRRFAAGALDAARRALLEGVAAAHAAQRRASAVSLEAVRGAARRFHPALVEAALQELTDEGSICVEGATARLPGRGARLTPEEETALAGVERRVREGGLAPPTVDELADAFSVERSVLHDLLRLLVEREAVVPLTPEIFVAREEAERARTTARALLAHKRSATAGDFKAAFGVSRKYLIPLLEYLDRIGVTRRVGEARELAAR